MMAVTFAMGRHRNPLIWLLAGSTLGPAAVALLLVLPRGKYDPAIGLRPECMDLCLSCFEPIQKDTPECRYCGLTAPFNLPVT
jgi:hypothetical protein